MDRPKDMKFKIQRLMEESYGDFIKGLISIEKDIQDNDLLDYLFNRYYEGEFNILTDDLDYLIEEYSLELDAYDLEI